MEKSGVKSWGFIELIPCGCRVHSCRCHFENHVIMSFIFDVECVAHWPFICLGEDLRTGHLSSFCYYNVLCHFTVHKLYYFLRNLYQYSSAMSRAILHSHTSIIYLYFIELHMIKTNLALNVPKIVASQIIYE